MRPPAAPEAEGGEAFGEEGTAATLLALGHNGVVPSVNGLWMHLSVQVSADVACQRAPTKAQQRQYSTRRPPLKPGCFQRKVLAARNATASSFQRVKRRPLKGSRAQAARFGGPAKLWPITKLILCCWRRQALGEAEQPDIHSVGRLDTAMALAEAGALEQVASNMHLPIWNLPSPKRPNSTTTPHLSPFNVIPAFCSSSYRSLAPLHRHRTLHP